MPMKKISVIIPVYNVEKYIERCLLSLENQCFKNFEVILVNDGSTDKTEKIILDYWSKSELDIKYFYEDNAGQAYARNAAMAKASGKYIAFIDSDDYIDFDYLQQLELCAESNESDMVSCGYRVIDEKGKIIGKCNVSPFSRESGFGRAGFFAVWGRLFRRDFLMENHISFPVGKIYEDVPVAIYAKFYAKNVRSLSYIGYNYCRHLGSTMKKNTVNSKKFPMEEMDKTIKRLVDADLKYRLELEFDVLCFFAGFLFLYCGRADKQEVFTLCRFALEELESYFPMYWKNPYLGIRKSKELPLVNRLCIQLFVVTSRLPLFKEVVYLVTRIIGN